MAELCGVSSFLLVLCAGISRQQQSLDSTDININPDPLKITDVCPGVEHLMTQNSTDITILQANMSTCTSSLYPLAPYQGVVYGLCDQVTPFCTMVVRAPQGRQVRARIQRLAYDCDSRHWKTEVMLRGTEVILSGRDRFNLECHFYDLKESFVDSDTSFMLIVHTNSPPIEVSIDTRECSDFIVKKVLKHSTCLITPYVTYTRSIHMHFKDESKIPMAYIVSLQQISYCGRDGLVISLYFLKPNTAVKSKENLCIACCPSAMVFNTPQLQIKYNYYSECQGGLKLLISVFHRGKQLLKLRSELFNCSVPYYSDFQSHLHCDQCTDCEDGRDETGHCPFSNADCEGLVASRNKCFKLIVTSSFIPTVLSDSECHNMNKKLASVKTLKELVDLQRLLSKYIRFVAAIGLGSGWRSVPFLYSKLQTWFDATLIYNMNHIHSSDEYVPSRTSEREIMTESGVKSAKDFKNVGLIICELQLKSKGVFDSPVSLAHAGSSTYISMYTRQRLFICPTRSAAHQFLLCETKSHCMKGTDLRQHELVNVSCAQPGDTFLKGRRFTYTPFICGDDMTTVHHTLLCDFKQDCPDRSDESFCEYLCAGFLCSVGQCVSLHQRCNQYTDCVDDSDEVGCSDDTTYHPPIEHGNMKQQLYVDLDGTGYFTQLLMKKDDVCPDSHYHCPSEWLYCLPIYTRCNGFFDCVNGEDELGCQTMMRPGFYRCRASAVCVHGDHLCDGWGQCPQRDDELMCDSICPEACQCQGHVFLCSEPFLPDDFSQLRYVDATGSNMSLADFKRNRYLVVLILSHCFIHNISLSRSHKRNLKYVDIGRNNVKTLNMAVFFELPNLRILNVEKNPVNKLASKKTKHILYLLNQVGMSQTHINILHTDLSLYLPSLEIMNISFGAVETIGRTGLKSMPQIQKLDSRGNALSNFPLDMFSRSEKLQRIYSWNYRICCKSLLPQHLHEANCVAPATVLSSCETLLPTDVYRAFFGLIGVFAVTGYVACCIASSKVKNMVATDFMVSVAHLQFADVCMGCHVIINVAADLTFRGHYMHIEKAWTSSVTCKLAGFLFFLSSTVSVMIVWFMTVYHVIAFSFPNELLRLKKHRTVTACITAWVLGILLAVVPFLPGLSHWGLHGQSGLCRLALVNHYHSKLRFKWFSVIVAINFILSLTVGAGQGIIFRRIPKYRITLDSTHRLLYSSVHVMRKVAITDAVCWFAYGLIIMISNFVTDVSKIQGIVVVFMMPFSSALNPLLYMWTVHIQLQREKQETKLLQVFKSRSRAQKHLCGK